MNLLQHEMKVWCTKTCLIECNVMDFTLSCTYSLIYVQLLSTSNHFTNITILKDKPPVKHLNSS